MRNRLLTEVGFDHRARKLCQYNPDMGRVPATMTAISDAVEWAYRIMWEIDRRCPEIGDLK